MCTALFDGPGDCLIGLQFIVLYALEQLVCHHVDTVAEHSKPVGSSGLIAWCFHKGLSANTAVVAALAFARNLMKYRNKG